MHVGGKRHIDVKPRLKRNKHSRQFSSQTERFEGKYCFSFPHMTEKKHYKWTVFFSAIKILIDSAQEKCFVELHVFCTESSVSFPYLTEIWIINKSAASSHNSLLSPNPSQTKRQFGPTSYQLHNESLSPASLAEIYIEAFMGQSFR